MYLFWEDNRWVIWKILGQNFYCNPWWAFWNCREVYGWIRYDYNYKCPEKVNSLWKSAYTENIDTGIKVKCSVENTPISTTSNPGKFVVIKRQKSLYVTGKQAYCFNRNREINNILQMLGPGFPCGRKPHRIVGGSEAGPYSLPWQVGLVRKNSNNRKPFCGGTLISNRHILTAAHCTNAISRYRILGKS